MAEEEVNPHDVLAAEEFGVPAPDPALHVEKPHDVLAAEEYGMPAADPVLHHHGPVRLPDDPTGIAEPHDVLAAEEFAMPAPPPGAHQPGSPRRGTRRTLAAGGALVAVVALRLRKRRGSGTRRS
jgi:hypothetical protein